MSRLLLIEGMPGSGKTTAVRVATRWLSARGLRVQAFQEGDPQPADLAWQWWLTWPQFEQACAAYPGAAGELRRCAWRGSRGVAVAYTKVDPARCEGQWPLVQAALGDREPFEGRLTPDEFVDVLVGRWADFGEAVAAADAPDVVIFDGAFLQDTLVELVLFGQRDADALTVDLRRLVAAVIGWRPLLVRLVPLDPAAALGAAERERVDESGHAYWRDAVEAYIAGTPWARARGLTAPGAHLPYLTHRQHLEAEILPRLPLDRVDLPSPAGTSQSWAATERRWQEILATLTG